MKVSELIDNLKKFPPETDICLVDYRMNIHHSNCDEEDPSNGIGIQESFRIYHYNENVNIPFIGLEYKNRDYDDVGNLICYDQK